MRIPLFNLAEIRIYASRVYKRTGVHSLQPKLNKHALLLDFDEGNLDNIINNLKLIQKRYKLPNIYIVESSFGRYHAYSLACRELKEIIHIVSAIPDIDIMFLRLGIARGYYTLRISKRSLSDFELKRVLYSSYPSECTWGDLSVSNFYTKNGGE